MFLGNDPNLPKNQKRLATSSHFFFSLTALSGFSAWPPSRPEPLVELAPPVARDSGQGSARQDRKGFGERKRPKVRKGERKSHRQDVRR